MAGEPNPTLARRELAVILRHAREQHGYTAEDLARHLDVSGPQASRLDTGARGYRPEDVRKLASWYRLGRVESDRLVALANEARRRAWWQQIDLPDAYRTLIGYEQAAEKILEYTSSVIPGLLQTPAYTRVQVRSWDSEFTEELVEQVVETRQRRQKVLARVPPPQLRVVIDEVGLARAPLDNRIRREQFEHLLSISERPAVTVRVIGLEEGMYPGVGRNLIALEMGGRVPDLVYTEGVALPSIVDQPEAQVPYRRLWNELRDVALSSATSRERIAQYARASSP